MNNDIIPIMIIGSMKCGTTTLFSYLEQHPQICGGATKELEYFSLKMGEQKYKQGTYEQLFNIDYKRHKFIIDASTGYTKYPIEDGVPSRIKAYGLNPFFIYIVRNPLDRIRSHYNYMIRNKNWKGNIDSAHLINTSKYYMQLNEYENVFGKERIMLIDFEELKNHPKKVSHDIFQCIGANTFEINLPENPVMNKTVPVNRKRKAIEGKFRGLGGMVPSFAKKWFRLALAMILPAKQKQLSNKQKEKIKKQLTEDMHGLQINYDINVSKWGF